MTIQETKELTGQFSEEKAEYGSTVIKYTNSINPNAQQEVELRKLYKLYDEVKVLEDSIKKDFSDSLAKILPANFKVQNITLPRNGYEKPGFICSCNGLHVEKKYTTPQKEETDPYKLLARHHELKSILNSGVLTKSEKRKVLGLPELKEGEND